MGGFQAIWGVIGEILPSEAAEISRQPGPGTGMGKAAATPNGIVRMTRFDGRSDSPDQDRSTGGIPHQWGRALIWSAIE